MTEEWEPLWNMLSDAAKARAVSRGPGAGGFLLAHHWSGQLDRCYQTWIGRRPVWFCSRCCGVYPALFLVLTLQFIFDIPRGWWDLLWLFLAPLPALVDWSLGRLAIRPGTNLGRTVLGVFLGASLGRMVYLNMLDPANTLVVIQIAGFIGVVLLVESARPLVIRRREAGS